MRKALCLLLSALVVAPPNLWAAAAELSAPGRVVEAPVLPQLPALPALSLAAMPGVQASAAGISAIGGNVQRAAAPLASAAAPVSAAASPAPAAAASPAQAAARAQLSAAQAVTASPKEGPAPSAAERRAASDRFWSGAAGRKADEVSGDFRLDPEMSARPSGLTKPFKVAKAAGLAAVAAPLTAHAAPAPVVAAASWLAPIWHSVQPYAIGGVVLGATYAANRFSRWLVDKLAKRGHWDPNTTDTVRFFVTVASWSAGAAVGLSLAGASATTLLTGFGIALSLAVKKTVGNLLQGVVFLVNRPFLIGEKIRVADTIYQVDDMQLQYVTLRALGRLVADKPDPVAPGTKVVPLKEVDPLGREVDDKGYKWAVIRTVAPGPEAREGIELISRQKYSNLAAASITLYRPYTVGHKFSPPHLSSFKKPAAFASFGKVFASVTQHKGSLLRAAIWMAASIALIPLLPLAKAAIAWKAAATIFPYIHGLASIWATRQVARFFEKLVPTLGEKFGWSRQSVVVSKLLIQVGVYVIGLSAGMRAIGMEWRSLATSLGATAAALSFASSDMLGNLAQALMLRFDRPFNIGDTLRVGADVGVVEEMNMFYVVLRVADGSHTLVPYSVIDASSLDTYPSREARQDQTHRN